MKRRTRNAKVQFCLLGLILLTITTGALAQTGAGPRDAGRSLGSVSGRVLDQRGDSIGGARVNALGQANWPSLGTGQMTTTDGNGNFRLSLSQGQYELRVTASGFASQTRRLEVGESPLQIQVTLEPGRFAEELTVTPARTEIRMSEAPASVSVLDSQDVTRAGAQTIDDLLRQVPGFSIFRRSSSLVANPTTQGVSLRGAGASGASRTLVLTDGIPLNDAFGGWVYWDRVARTSIDRVELVRGGASDLYGSDALSGVINVLTRPPSQSVVNAEASYGARDTSDVSFFASQPWKGVGVAVSGEALRTDGYFIIAPELRGRADERAGSRHRLLNLRLDHNWKTDQSVFIRGSLFDEDRQNGTQLQRNDTATESVAVGGRWKTPDGSLWNLALFANQQRFHQSFTAVAADRNTETLTRLQFVPSRDAGFSFNWSRAGLDKHLLVAGIDLRGVRGTSDELVYVTGRPSSVVSAGGRQRRLGFFAQDLVSLSARWQLALSARYDNWRDSSAASVTRSLATGLIQPQFFAPHSAGAFSPRLSVIFRPQQRLALRAAVYRAFRAPTLNELYRAFRVGDTLTLANQNLTAERLTGGEIGGTWNPSRKTSVRLTGYWTEIVNPISNFT
ncbi:MAG TPA: TonB-dependent receptor, partial [Blastocatellia bacterium]|nr:TonB-dependent receptor [Blastocatellia bacterium]